MHRKSFLKAGSAFAFVLVAGCASTQPISVEQLNGSTEVAQGETAAIHWNFKNAEYVRVEGIDRQFKSMDTLTFRPDISKNFRIVGYQGRDSAVRMWNVRVYSAEPPVSVQTGPVSEETSATPSQYFGGKILSSRGAPLIPDQVKILSASRENGSIVLKTLPLDRNGNFLNGLDDAANFQWTITYRCNADSTGFKSVAVSPVIRTDAPLSLAVCLDRSASASFSAAGYNAVRNFSEELAPQDKFGFIYFNQDIGKIPLQNPADVRLALNGFTLPAAHGLSAVYKAAFTGIDMLDESQTSLKALVVITGSADNASIIYTADDIANEAKKLNIPVYTIRVGDATESYPLKYISSYTGGKYYYLPNGRSGEISDILKEIVNAQKVHYELTAPDAALQNCPDVQAQLILNTPGGEISNSAMIALEEQNLFPQYQALAIFAKRDTTVSADYLETLQSFAEVLKDNPTKVIELTGNSSTDGDDDYNMMIALKRAQTVRRALVDMGVSPSQIRVRAEGNRRPVYYFQNAAWQEDYNRRVEVRWLDPALLPYEITAGIVATEEEALLKTDEWEKRGAKAYYETIYYQKQPAFRIKLWGYPGYGEAAAAAREFQRKYGGNLSVE